MSRGGRGHQLATAPLHQAGQYVTLGFHSVYFISNGNTCREAWSPEVPPVLVFTELKRREDSMWGTL